jgi:hypothetical protein
MQILNNGYILINGINNTSSTAIEYIKNLSSDAQTQINNINTSLSNYVLNSTLTTTLSDYVLNSTLTTTLSDYVLNSSLTTTLSDYVTNSALTTQFTNFTNNVLAPYYATIAYVNSQNYLTSASLSSYITSSSLASTLSSYVLSSSLTTTINSALTNFTNDVLVPYYASIYGANHWTNESNSFVSFTFYNKINNVWASTFDYIKNLTSDAQTQLNGKAGLDLNNTFTQTCTFNNLLNVDHIATYRINCNDIQTQNLNLKSAPLGSLAGVVVLISPNAFSLSVKNYAHCIIINNCISGNNSFVFNQSSYNVGQVVKIHNANLNYNLYITSTILNQRFYFGSYVLTNFNLYNYQSCELTYIGNDHWFGIYSNQAPSGTNINNSGFVYYYESTTYPTIPTYDPIQFTG